MADADIRLAARLARAAGRIHPTDWIEVYESHNSYEWALQIALSVVDPWGDDRDDLRHAVNTAQRVASQAAESQEAVFDAVVDAMTKYLKIHRPDEAD